MNPSHGFPGRRPRRGSFGEARPPRLQGSPVSPLQLPPYISTSLHLLSLLIRYSSDLVLSRTQEAPKALLPVANRPVLSYVLELLEASNLKDAIVVRF